MAPKRRAAAAAAKAGGKKAKEEPDRAEPKDAFTSAKEALLAAGPQARGKRKVDEHSHGATSGAGEGEVGQSKPKTFNKPEDAVKDFEKKFKDKTKNNWSDRVNFVSHPGKYTLIEVDGEQDAEVKVDSVDGKNVVKNVLPCALDGATQDLIQLIFSNDMFKEAMECMNLDTKKMPLGKLSKLQIAKGFEVLQELETAMTKKSGKATLQELSSKFFTTVPHNFGRTRPPTIDSKDIVETKKEMLMVLADIELAQTLKSETEKAQEEMIETVPHPLDQDYSSLKCNLTLLDKDVETFEIIETYLKVTSGDYRQPKIVNVWEVDRETEGLRFSENDNLDNRHLLWHGTNIAVVAAILKSGLRIMPHSGGRVGCGIYFASENSKSAGYDPSKDISITLEGKKVSVPQGKPIPQPQFSDSHFRNSEYLIYKESQCRLRYLLELNM
ncbi:hypothetical protein F2P81_012725 [Scophthalmus maximus]|uniref:Poly [ADP-ribose] polymerase n=1 Tax=Scophthalmus maximus TaxID=52904 RepID=A0A6A4SP08_SCOMX|nr:hypothetical protein F2P81_012725 [Scophthalmus maximus]